MQKRMRIMLVFSVVIAVFLNIQIALHAAVPPIVYVAGDGSGDYNCDGTADQVQINQALEFVADNADYTTVYLKGSNTFWIDEPIVMPSNTKLKGDSSATVQLIDYAPWPNNKPMIRQKGEPHWGPDGDLGEALLGADDDFVANIEISGFKLTGGNNDDKPVGQYYVIPILFYKAHNIKVHDMTLLKSRGDTIRIFNGKYVKIYNNWMKETGHESVYFKYVENVDIYDNEMYVTRANDAIRTEHCSNLSLHGNIIKNSLELGPNGYAGIYIESGILVPLGYCEIYDNVMFAKCSGIMIKSELGDKRVKDIHIHHNVFYKILFRRDHLHGGIHLMGVQNTLIEFNTFDQCEKDAIIYEWGKHEGEEPGYKTIVRNNIISNSERYGIDDLTDSRHTFICEYNNIYNSGYGNYNNASSTTDIHVDPLYVHNTGTDPDAIDLHLKSQTGRWNGTTWVNDAVTSPCINAGDPAEDCSSEPSPHGNRVNMGAYGNTAQASKKTGDGSNEPPMIDAGSDQVVFDSDENGSEEVTLDGSGSSDWDGNIVSYNWDFGDGQNGSGATVSHTYAVPGSYTATLTVTDDDGATNTDTVDITSYKTSYHLTYTSGPNGSITGDLSQIVAYGLNGSDVTAVPDPGYRFVDWSDGFPSAYRADTDVSADVNVTANFAEDIPPAYRLIVDKGSGSGDYVEGSVINISADVPAAGYHFTNWTASSGTVADANSAVTTYTMPDLNVTLKALYSNQYNLLYMSTASGSISGDSSQIVESGSDGTEVTAVAIAGHHFVCWSDGVATVSRKDTCVSADLSVTANFAKDGPAYKLIVVNGHSDGNYEEGAPVAISADPAPVGYHFANWTTSNGGSFANANSVDTTYTMPANKATITANYAVNQYALAYIAAAGTHGSIIGDASQTVTHGSSGTEVTAVPDTDFHFVCWTDGVPTASRTDSNVTGDITTTAIFAENGATEIVYDSATNAFVIGGFTPLVPCTLEDVYEYDLENGTGKVTRTINGSHFEYTINASLNIGGDVGDYTYFQIGHNAGGDSRYNDEVLIITGNIRVDAPGGSAHSYLNIGSPTDATLNPTIKFNCSSDGEFYIGRDSDDDDASKTRHLNYYNCTLESNTGHRYRFGSNSSVRKSDQIIKNVVLNDYDSSYWSSYKGISFLTDCTMNTTTRGYYAGHTSTVVMDNVDITGTKRGIYGLYYPDITVMNSDITGMGDDAICTRWDRGVKIASSNLTAGGSDKYGASIEVYTNDVRYIRDSLLKSTNSNYAVSFNCYESNGVDASLEITNTSYNSNTKIEEVEAMGTLHVDRNWYLDVRVEDTNGNPIPGAIVSVTSNNGGEVNTGYASGAWVMNTNSSQITGANGHTPLPSTGNSFILRDYRRTSSGATEYTYTINVSAGGYDATELSGINPGISWYRANPDVPQNTQVVVMTTNNTTYNLTYTAGAHGSISGDSSQTVIHGFDGTEVTAVPDAGYNFVNWSDGVNTLSRIDTNITSNINVTANFAIFYGLTVTNGLGDGNYMSGTAVAITADAPATGYHFTNWTTSNGGTFANANSSSTTYTMPAHAVTVTANYAINQYTLNYTAGAHGSISGTTLQTVPHGSNGTQVTAIADSGCYFTGWSDGITTASRTDTNVTGNITVAAGFAQNDAGRHYDCVTNSFIISGYTAAVPCTLEDLYSYDQANGPLNKITRSDKGTYYEYTLNSTLNIGGNANKNTYFQIGHNTGGNSKFNDEVLIITGNIEVDASGDGSQSYLNIGSATDATLNPTIKFNCSSDGEFYIGRTGEVSQLVDYSHFNCYNCTLESNTGHLYGFGDNIAVPKSDQVLKNVTLRDYQMEYWSNYTATVTMTDSTLNTSTYGYDAGHTSTLIADNISITTSGRGLNGAYHHNLILTNSDITAAADGHVLAQVNAIYTQRDLGIKIASSTIIAEGSGQLAARLDAANDDVRYIRDCVLRSTSSVDALSLSCYEDEEESGLDASLEVTNVSYTPNNTGVKGESVEDAGGTLHVDRNFYLDVKVEDVNGNPIPGATVSVTSNDGGEVNIGYASGVWEMGANADQVTGADGHTPLPSTGKSFILKDYTTTGTRRTEYTYTITASKGGYDIVELSGVNPAAVWYRADMDVPQNTQVIVLTENNTTHTLTYTAGPNGSISGATTQTVTHGFDGSEVTAVPNMDYSFIDWSDGVTTASRIDTNVTADISVTANFAILYNLTVNNGSGDGNYESGTAVSITADTAPVGYHFSNWTTSGGGSFANANSANTTYTMPANAATITANYAMNQYTLTYTAGPNGSISGNVSQTVAHGGNGSEVVAVANTGYHFSGWNDGVSTASRTDINITADLNVTANFAQDGTTTYTLTVIDGNGNGDYEEGTVVSISADTPPVGYHFVVWTTSDGGSFANANSSTTTYTMPANSATITANFTEDGSNEISYNSVTNSFIVGGYISSAPCTLEDIYVYDQNNGPLNKITRSDKGTYYEYTLNASIKVGKDTGKNTYFQIGHNTGGNSKFNDEVLTITGDIIADVPGNGAQSYITVGSSSDDTLNPTIRFNCSADKEFYIGRIDDTGHTNYYNCTLESANDYLFGFGGNEIHFKSDQNLVNVTLHNHQSDFWTGYHATTTMTNCTLNTSGEMGYWAGHTSTVIADHVSITGKNWGLCAYHYGDITVTNADLNSTIEEAFYTARDVGVKIASSDLEVLGSIAYAMRLEAFTDGIRYIRDSSLKNTRPDNVILQFECYEEDGDEVASLEATNVTYNSDVKTEYVEDAGTLHVDRNWYLDVKVEDEDGNPIQGATVSVASSDGGEINTGYATGVWDLSANSDQTTGMDGHTPLPSTGNSFILRDYRRTSTEVTEYTYTISVSRNGYNSAVLSDVNPGTTWYRTDMDVPQNTQVIVLTSSTPNQAPVASASASPTSGNPSLTVNFDGSASSDPDGTIDDYYWNFGDGKSDTGAIVSHTYTTAGSYTATLYVVDDKGATANDTVVITVADGNPPHSADTDGNWSISQAEVNSFIASYNNNNNTVATENGDITAGRITMREVMRVIYLYNNGGAYQGGQATIDTYDIAETGVASSQPADNTITVVNSADSGAGSFRDAIANAVPGDTITFDESLEKILLASEIVIDKSITIDGNGVTIVSGNGGTRIFQVYNENDDIFVSILNMGIVDANNSADEFGGAIYNNGENLTLENCLLNNNANTVANGKGGAIYSSGSLTVTNSVFDENTADEENDIYSTNDNVVVE